VKRQIDFIRTGTVIDHIKAGEAIRILKLLNLEPSIRSGESKVMIGCNFESARLGKKDIIKISGAFVTQREVNQITLLAPSASVTIVQDAKVVRKFKLSINSKIANIIHCVNPGCITNHEVMSTLFYPRGVDKSEFQCHYCEMILSKDQLKFNAPTTDQES
jgi:aspartate carbamoyltransferase regulatory subunit